MAKQKVTGKRVVESIPAKNQICKANHVSSVQQERITTMRERVEEEKKEALHYSYNSRQEQEGSRSGQRNGMWKSSESMSMTQVWKTVNHR